MVCTYWSIDNALIHTYTLPYLRQIQACIAKDAKIYLLTLSPPGNHTNKNNPDFVEKLRSENIQVINFTYHPFGPRMVLNFAFLFPYLMFFTWLKNIAILHAWCTPGGAIAWPIALFTRRPLVLDSFEPHAVSMVENNTWSKSGFAYKLLFWLEKKQLQYAREVICAAPGMDLYSQKLYGISKTRYFVKPACVDLELFKPGESNSYLKNELGLKGIVAVYSGKFGGIYLDQEVFDFFRFAENYWKGHFTALLLTSHSKSEIKTFCHRSGVSESTVKSVFVPHDKMPEYLKLADFALTPVKPVPSKKFCSPIKDGEYWAMGLPVVIPKNISNDSDTIEENQIGYVLQDFSDNEYLHAIQSIENILKEKNSSHKIREIAKTKRSFENSLSVYQTIYATNGVYSNGTK